MMQASNRSFVCWRCSARRFNSYTTKQWIPNQTPLSKISTRALATVQHPDGSQSFNTFGGNDHEEVKKLNIRQQLRIWEKENPAISEKMVTDNAPIGALSNTFTRPQTMSTVQLDADQLSSSMFEGDELEDLRTADSTLIPGDLVELVGQWSRRPMLAICLGNHGGYDHFYTSNGNWLTSPRLQTLFSVPNFVTPAEVQPILSTLPMETVTAAMLNTLLEVRDASRVAGASLVEKMLHFSQTSETIYRDNAAKLDATNAMIGDTPKYLSLHEIAELVLPSNLQENGKFPLSTLYAVHRALMDDSLAFRPLRPKEHTSTYLFEVSPKSEIQMIEQVDTIVRGHIHAMTTSSTKYNKEPSGTQLAKFVSTARRIIDQSRKSRSFSPHGVIGPSIRSSQVKADSSTNWSESDIAILKFLERWTGYQKFSLNSRHQCIGSAILRAVNRYQEADFFNASTGWTMLQELGWIPPWEIPFRYNARLPGVEIKRGGAFERPQFPKIKKLLNPDPFEGHRKQWDGVTAYCIDSETTLDIDDAVSVEKGPEPDQYWIHTHVSDVASFIDPHGPLAEYAELVPETIYLPGHFCRMLPGGIDTELFSLDSKKPCMTFSALVNEKGSLLDSKVGPGILGKVVHINGQDVNKVLEETNEDFTAVDDVLEIGAIPNDKPVPKDITRPDQITSEQRQELATMARLGRALQDERIRKGALPFFGSRPKTDVYFDEVEQVYGSDGSIQISGDPSISIYHSRYMDTDLVGNAMKLAGEVAARWCHKRGIPILYQTQPHGIHNAAAIQQYVHDVFLPAFKAGFQVDEKHRRRLRLLTGDAMLSTNPTPYFILGVDMYAKATSPLRRYGDLILHWQIGAALREEMRRGTSLAEEKTTDESNDGHKKDLSFLPFSRECLDRKIPMFMVREQNARALTRGEATRQWLLYGMIRAWHFKEAPLPETFRFTISYMGRSMAIGRLNWFNLKACIFVEGLRGVISAADLHVGDVLKVELTDVNVHTSTIKVRATEVLEKAVPEAAIGVQQEKAEGATAIKEVSL